MFRYICSVCLCLGILARSAPVWARASHRPTGIHLGVDVFRPFQYKYYERKGTQYELNACTDFSSMMLEGDYGWGSICWEGYNPKADVLSSYTSSGQYFRVGLNYNFLPDTPNKNQAFLGLRYATSFFQDQLVSKVVYDSTGLIKGGGGRGPINSKQTNVRARWFEAVAGVKVRIWRLLYAGGTIRYKFVLRTDYAKSYVPYDVLGWGLNEQGASFGVSYYLSLRIPLASETSVRLKSSQPHR
ncbi:MAG: DUF6048 family protein [Amoebophilaceae bacterium]|nr:DUF6048 family protein [Amoebophilaceae bacterium]